jgi:CRP-like cAMP-binding protein
VSTSNISETIRSNPIFASLTSEQAEELASHCEVLILPPDFRLFSQGEISEDMFVLFKGKLSLRVQDSAGGEMEVGRLNSGEVFGEMGVLEREARSASVVTTEDAIVLKIPGAGFYHMIELAHPAIHLLLAHTLDKACSRLRSVDERLDGLFY